MKIDFTGKVALVTASTGGIGSPSPEGWQKAVPR